MSARVGTASGGTETGGVSPELRWRNEAFSVRLLDRANSPALPRAPSSGTRVLQASAAFRTEKEIPMSSRPVESHDARRVEQAREQAAGNCYEAVPTVWDEERESRFFGVVRDVLPPRFLF